MQNAERDPNKRLIVMRVIASMLVVFSMMGLVGSGPAKAGVLPDAVDDAHTTAHGVPLIVGAPGVLGNDTLPAGPDYLVEVITNPIHGVLVLLADGSFTYSPNLSFVGIDTFEYGIVEDFEVNGDIGDAGVTQELDVATVTISVTNELPIPIDDSYSTAPDVDLDVDAANGVLANDISPDGDDIFVFDVTSQPAHGSVIVSGDGSFTYAPDTGFEGTDTFEYVLSDLFLFPVGEIRPLGVTDTGVVTITIQGEPTPTATSEPEPTIEPTVEPGQPTATPEPPAPTATASSPVTELPDTGAGPRSGSGSSLLAVAILLVALTVIGLTRRFKPSTRG